MLRSDAAFRGGHVHRRRKAVEIFMLLCLQGCVAAEHRCQEPARATDADQKQNDAETRRQSPFHALRAYARHSRAPYASQR